MVQNHTNISSSLFLHFTLIRNYRLTCQQLPGLDLSSWQSDEEPEFSTESFDGDSDQTSATPHLNEDINEDVIKEAIVKAKINMNERAKFEYDSWLNGMLLLLLSLSISSCFVSFCFGKMFMKSKLTGGAIDARSPDGTAASFSKANRNAIKIANNSLFFEFVSNEIMNTLEG